MSKKSILILATIMPFLLSSCSSSDDNNNRTNPSGNTQGNGITDSTGLENLVEPTTPEVDPNLDTEDKKYNFTFKSPITSDAKALEDSNQKLLYTSIGLSPQNATLEPEVVSNSITITASDPVTSDESYKLSNINNSINYTYNPNFKEVESDTQIGLNQIAKLKESFNENLKKYPIINNNNINFKAAASKTTYKIGDKKNDIYLHDMGNQEKINTTCKYISESAYFFIEDSVANNIPENVLADIAKTFEKDKKVINKIYANNEDIDNNGKIIFVIAPLKEKGLKGFFSGNDKLKSPQSNNGDYLYINSNLLSSNETYKNNRIALLSTLVHEYQHMTLFDYRHINKKYNVSLYKVNDWIDEGLSMLAEYHAGYGVNHRQYLVELFKHSNEISLLKFDNKIENYGYSLLFFRYMHTRFKDDFIKRLYDTQENGIKLINETANIKAKLKLDQIFQEFLIMILVSGRDIVKDNPRYNVVQFNHNPKAIDNNEKYWYIKNGFNLADVIDEVYKNDFKNPLTNLINNKDKTLNLNLQTYGFQLTRWTEPQTSIKRKVESSTPPTLFWSYYYQY